MGANEKANAHHKLAHATAFPDVAYKKSKNDEHKYFIYDNRKHAVANTSPVAIMIAKGGRYKLNIDGVDIIDARTIPECLKIISARLQREAKNSN